MNNYDANSLPIISSPEKSALIPGSKYRAKKAITDAYGEVHPVGEEWTYVGFKSSGYDNMYFLSIRVGSDDLRSLPLRSSGDADESKIIGKFDEYVAPP